MNSTDLIRIFSLMFISTIFAVIAGYLEILLIKDTLQIIVLEELVLLIPTLLLARTLIGITTFSTVSGLILGLLKNAMAMGAPHFILIHILTALITGFSTYPYKKSKNPMFLVLILIGLFISILFHWFANYYGDLWFGLQGLFYAFQ